MTPGIRTAGYIAVALIMGAAVSGVWVHFSGQARRAEKSAAEWERIAHRLASRADSAIRAEFVRRDSMAASHAAKLDTIQRQQRAIADSLSRVRGAIPRPDTTQSDSLRYWKGVANEAVAEVVALRATVAAQDSVSLIQVGRIAALTAEVQAQYAALDSVRVDNARLAVRVDLLERRQAGCRVAGASCGDLLKIGLLTYAVLK